MRTANGGGPGADEYIDVSGGEEDDKAKKKTKKKKKKGSKKGQADVEETEFGFDV